MADYSFLNGKNIVTFDVFDTLVHRRTLAPMDVFHWVRLRAHEEFFIHLHHNVISNFVEHRVKAEQRSREGLMRSRPELAGEVTYDEIYQQLEKDTQLPTEVVSWLKECELSMEAAALIASAEGLEVFKEAERKGCQIAFISDMYLPSAWLLQMLISVGYTSASKYPIFVSCEHGASKHNGELYARVASRQKWSLNNRWLHIGDNHHADVSMARASGLSSYLVHWIKHQPNVPSAPTEDFAGELAHSIVDAFALKQHAHRLPNDPLAHIGYTVFGPFLFGFVCWLMSEIKRRKLDSAVFVARDGWLLKKLFERCSQHLDQQKVSSSYFFFSRAVGYTTGIRDWLPDRSWHYVSGKSGVTARNALAKVGLDAENYHRLATSFGINGLDTAIPQEDRWRLCKLVNAASYETLLKGVEIRSEFSSYFEKTSAAEKEIALVDIGWVGNIQRCFVHSFRELNVNDHVHGFYIGIHPGGSDVNKRLGLKLNGWLNESCSYHHFHHLLVNGGVELLEFILTSDHGSALGLKRDGDLVQPVLEEQSPLELEHQRCAMAAQTGVLKFFEDHLDLLKLFDLQTLGSPGWAAKFFQMVEKPDREQAELLGAVTHSDGAGANSARTPLAIKVEGGRTQRGTPSYNKARDASFWKSAFDVLNS